MSKCVFMFSAGILAKAVVFSILSNTIALGSSFHFSIHVHFFQCDSW
ncbi:uncharacterized protein M6B38_268685 [Iris pallida]|uniref:Uncharacterized protein n=1 Tax=Iris pallida TaxID=29817 RepID=A0AAX6IAK5_IRIPA|nr:uncharacterized protein M6B38_268685 [Iris pallida]